MCAECAAVEHILCTVEAVCTECAPLAHILRRIKGTGEGQGKEYMRQECAKCASNLHCILGLPCERSLLIFSMEKYYLDLIHITLLQSFGWVCEE